MASATAKAPRREGLVRTNVVLDEALVQEAMRLTGIRTKREVIAEALRRLVGLREQEGALERLWGAAEWDGNLAEMRKRRVFDGSR
ncbi:MAG: type II toxin-antitoxin system VapB family antitoxin [Armatimonadetes bacterium]|nr:type II toxin-antitoxin system VapB family antitoxin [Armatimonadota bacterium]